MADHRNSGDRKYFWTMITVAVCFVFLLSTIQEILK